MLSNIQADTIGPAIRAGVVACARKGATVGATIHVPAPDWTPTAGAPALVPVTVKSLVDGAIVCADTDGQIWAVWA